MFLSTHPDLSSKRNLATAHKQTRDPHPWIALDFVYVEKLLRSEKNSQILRYLHFSNLSPAIVHSPFEIQLSARGKSSRPLNMTLTSAAILWGSPTNTHVFSCSFNFPATLHSLLPPPKLKLICVCKLANLICTNHLAQPPVFLSNYTKQFSSDSFPLPCGGESLERAQPAAGPPKSRNISPAD